MFIFRIFFRDCDGYYHESLVTDVLAFVSFFSYFLPLILWAASYVHREVYTFLFSFFSTVNWLLNLVLRDWIIRQRVPDSTCNLEKFGMPSYEVQQAWFLNIFVFTYAIYWRGAMRWGVFTWGSTIMSTQLYVALVVAAQVELGGNTPLQCFVGCGLGISLGMFSNWIIFYVLFPRFDYLLELWPIKWMGYVDNMCRVLMLDPKFKKIYEYRRATATATQEGATKTTGTTPTKKGRRPGF